MRLRGNFIICPFFNDPPPVISNKQFGVCGLGEDTFCIN